MDKADVERAKEKIRGYQAQIEELAKDNKNGENARAIMRLEQEIENLYRYIYEDWLEKALTKRLGAFLITGRIMKKAPSLRLVLLLIIYY